MSIDVGSAVGYLDLDTNKWNSGLKSAWASMQDFTDKTMSTESRIASLGAGMQGAGKSLTKGLTLPLALAGAGALKFSMDFGTGMSNVKAITQASTAEMKKMKDAAIELGASTAFSATQVADGMANLGSAGFTTSEILKAMPGMLDLAASSGTDLALASEIAATALRGFGLDAASSAHVADVFAKAAADTNAGVTDMGEAMKYIAPVAKAMGYSIESTAAAVGILSDAGIKGGQAGTTLRGALSRLASPSKEAADAMASMGWEAYDAQGKMKALPELIGSLKTSLAGYTDEQKQAAIVSIFGQEAMSGMMVLMDAGPAKINKLTKSFEDSDGAASAMAKTMQDNLKGTMDQLGGAVESLGIAVGDIITPAIRGLADMISSFVNWLNQADESTKKLVVGLGAVLAAAGPLLLIGGKLVTSFVAIQGAFAGAGIAAGVAAPAVAGAGVAATGLGTAFAGALIPLSPWIVGIGLVVGAGMLLKKKLSEEVTPEVDLFASKVDVTSQTITTAHGRIVTSAEQTITKISKATKEAVGAYIDLDDKATESLTNLYFNSDVITTQIKDNTVSSYLSMADLVIQGLNKRYDQEYTIMQDFFAKSAALNEGEEAAALEKLTQDNEDKKVKEQEYVDQINLIMQTASEQKRALTLEEQQQINQIQQDMKTNAITVLSENEVEAQIILERIKAYGTRITAEQASEILKNAEKQRLGAVKEANTQYDETVAAIIRMRDETHSITSDQADKLIAEAKRQKEDSITQTDELKRQAVEKITSMNADITKSIDVSTGDMLSTWDKLKNWWTNWKPEMKYFKYTVSGSTSGGGQGGGGGGSFALGLNYVPTNGFSATLHEGEAVLKKADAEDWRKGKDDSGGGDTYVFNSPNPITPAEARREMIKAKKELALNY